MDHNLSMGVKVRLTLALSSGVLLVLMLFGGPGAFAVRSLRHAWDLGHIVAFAVFCALLLSRWRNLSQKPFWTQTGILFLFGLVAGGMIEIAQGMMGGDPSGGDLGRDLIGCLVASAFFSEQRFAVEKPMRRGVQAVAVGLVMAAALPMVRAFYDEVIARLRFPVLADFESPFEIGRWSGNARLSIDRTVFFAGQTSLKVDLNTDRYSGATLKYFQGDWKGYDRLSFAVFNPEAEPLKISCKITDHAHDVSGYRYDNRFNRSYEITAGWHRIEVPIADIENAPRQRKMDLTQVTQLSIFASGLKHARTIYLDDLRLVKIGNG